jgi:Rrf2 family transcriptional regulator, iron-sulfur cluster assembly transcription factor
MRLEITRRADLAVEALALIGASDARWKSVDLAAELGTTTDFVPQIVGPLVKTGWLRSDPGPRGGYTSAVALDEVSVLQVIEVVDGPTDAGRCVVADRPCTAATPCTLHVAWARARPELLRVLADTPVSARVARHTTSPSPDPAGAPPT